MKRMKKCLSLALVLTMVVSLFAITSVSAAVVNIPMDYSDIVTYSFDITVPEGQILGIEFTAPANTASATNLGWSYGAGSVKMANGQIQAGKNWLGSENATIVSPCTAFPAGQVNNLMVRKNHRTGYTEFIANGVSFCTTIVDNKTLPISMLNVHGSAATTATIKNVFVKGTEVGEMAAYTEFNKANKQITVRFTEPLATNSDLSTAVLKKANGKEADTVPLTATYDGVNAVFTYEGTLEDLTEYVVVLPDGLTGALGGTVRNYPKFTTDAATLHQECDYNNGSAIIWKNDSANIAESGDADHGKVLPFTTYEESGNYGRNVGSLSIPADNIFTISFDVKVLVDTIKMGWSLWQQDGRCVTLAYGTTDGTANGNYMMIQEDNKATVDGWLGSGNWQTKIGTWKKDQWINYKLEFNRTDKTVKVYVDGVYKASKTVNGNITPAGKTIVAGSGNVFYFSAVGGTAPTESGKVFMYMDNFKVETIAEKAIVSGATFVDARGNEAGADGKISRLLDKVNVKFASAMDTTSLNADTVKLYYGETAVECTRAYDSATGIYTLTPSSIPGANAEVKVVVDGAKTAKAETVPAFETVVTADNQASELVVYEVDAVNETDVKPLNGNLSPNKFKYTKYYPIMRAANFTDKAQQVIVVASEYTADGLLNNVNISAPVTVNSGDYIRYGGKLNGENVIQAKDDTATIKTFVWDSLGNMTPVGTASTAIKNF